MRQMNYRDMVDHFKGVAAQALNVSPKEVHVHPSFYDTIGDGGGDSWIVAYKTGPVFMGRYKVEMAKDSFWGGTDTEDYVGEVLVDPTWEDLVVEAERMIRATNDTHHCFLESARVEGSELEHLATAHGDGVLTLTFFMGS